MRRTHAALLASLDPTYTLYSNSSLIEASSLKAYLRFFYILYGSLVIPRTYLIHGVRNPFFDLYHMRGGKRELEDLFSDADVYVSGHDSANFATLDGHLRMTASEKHPLVYESEDRLPYAKFLQKHIRSESIVLQLVGTVKRQFNERFKTHYLDIEHNTVKSFKVLDTELIALLRIRNKMNIEKYDVDKGEWGRNEVCDWVRTLPLGDPDAGKLIRCAVAAYQDTFVVSLPALEPALFLNVPRRSIEAEKARNFSQATLSELSDSGWWGFDIEKFAKSRWEQVCTFRSANAHLANDLVYHAAQHEGREQALDCLNELCAKLSSKYPGPKSLKGLVFESSLGKRPGVEEIKTTTSNVMDWLKTTTNRFILIDIILFCLKFFPSPRRRRLGKLLDYHFDWANDKAKIY